MRDATHEVLSFTIAMCNVPISIDIVLQEGEALISLSFRADPSTIVDAQLVVLLTSYPDLVRLTETPPAPPSLEDERRLIDAMSWRTTPNVPEEITGGEVRSIESYRYNPIGDPTPLSSDEDNMVLRSISGPPYIEDADGRTLLEEIMGVDFYAFTQGGVHKGYLQNQDGTNRYFMVFTSYDVGLRRAQSVGFVLKYDASINRNPLTPHTRSAEWEVTRQYSFTTVYSLSDLTITASYTDDGASTVESDYTMSVSVIGRSNFADITHFSFRVCEGIGSSKPSFQFLVGPVLGKLVRKFPSLRVAQSLLGVYDIANGFVQAFDDITTQVSLNNFEIETPEDFRAKQVGSTYSKSNLYRRDAGLKASFILDNYYPDETGSIDFRFSCKVFGAFGLDDVILELHDEVYTRTGESVNRRPLADGVYRFQNAVTKGSLDACVSNFTNPEANPAVVVNPEAHGRANQQWQIRYVESGTGGYYLISPLYDTSLMLKNNPQGYLHVGQAENNGSERWTIYEAPDGMVYMSALGGGNLYGFAGTFSESNIYQNVVSLNANDRYLTYLWTPVRVA